MRPSAPKGDGFLTKSVMGWSAERENSRQQPCRAWLASRALARRSLPGSFCQRMRTSRLPSARPAHYVGSAAAIQDPKGKGRRASSLAMFLSSRRQPVAGIRPSESRQSREPPMTIERNPCFRPQRNSPVRFPRNPLSEPESQTLTSESPEPTEAPLPSATILELRPRAINPPVQRAEYEGLSP